jgi:RNA polymerase sigma-70 factor (ECF subfamily)
MNKPADLMDRLIASRERFLAFVQRRISDPELAEDVLQSSLLKAVEALPQLKDEERLVPWFYSILRNSIIDSYRRGASQGQQVELDLAAELPDELAEEDDRTVCSCFEALIPSLKPEYREVLQSLDLDKQPTEDVAASLGLSSTNLKVRRHRARQALRRRLEETCRVCAEHHCLDCTCRPEVASFMGKKQQL